MDRLTDETFDWLSDVLRKQGRRDTEILNELEEYVPKRKNDLGQRDRSNN